MQVSTLEAAEKRGIEVKDILDGYLQRTVAVSEYVNAYQRYCWSVESITDLKLAPFHLLATEGTVHFDNGPLVAHGDAFKTM